MSGIALEVFLGEMQMMDEDTLNESGIEDSAHVFFQVESGALAFNITNPEQLESAAEHRADWADVFSTNGDPEWCQEFTKAADSADGWLVTATEQLEVGCHSWRVQIREWKDGGPIFIGVCSPVHTTEVDVTTLDGNQPKMQQWVYGIAQDSSYQCFIYVDNRLKDEDAGSTSECSNEGRARDRRLDQNAAHKEQNVLQTE